MTESDNLKTSLLKFLRCPDCHSELSVVILRESEGEIERGSLVCRNCGQVFPIVRFIPRFVSSDAYVRSFSAEWNIFSKTELDMEGKTESRDTFILKAGKKPQDLAGKVVLDAGCGMGRFSEVVSRETKATVVGFDLSSAVDSARSNIGSRGNVHVVQADIMRLPFADATFDFIYSIGVLHHTPNPKRSFERLVPLLKKGGEIVVWVYAKSHSDFYSDTWRKVTSRVPWSMTLGFSRIITKLYGVYRKFPYPAKFLPISMHKDPEWRLLDTFDWYAPKYQYKFETNEVVSWFEEMGFREIETLSFPVSVRGKR